MPFYANFDIDGYKSIFSEVDPASRTQRAKAVLPLFSTGNLRSGSDAIYRCVDKMVVRVKKKSRSGKPVNVLTEAYRGRFERWLGAVGTASKSWNGSIRRLFGEKIELQWSLQ